MSANQPPLFKALYHEGRDMWYFEHPAGRSRWFNKQGECKTNAELAENECKRRGYVKSEHPAAPVAGEGREHSCLCSAHQVPQRGCRICDEYFRRMDAPEPPVTDSQRPDKSFMDQFSPDQRNLMDALQDIADLKAELAAAKQDSERLDRILAHPDWHICQIDGYEMGTSLNSRAEIDAAMREGEG